MFQTPLIMMVFGDRRHLTARPETYHQLMDDARNAFGSKAVNLTVHCTSKSREPEFELDQSAYRVVEDGWVLRLMPKAAPIFKLELKLTGETFSLRISPAATVEELESALEARVGKCPEEYDIIFNGLHLDYDETLERHSITDDDTLNLIPYFANNYVLSFDDFTDLDKAAKSTVTLNPNTIAKVFLVFRGVSSMVGTDVDGMEDQSKFRVIEWGGMEVYLELE
ncbi:hypothetical protein CCUS01_12443 [Colletotrichum cuscutae]|uniref:Ubiquitin-like domain-containing protein n=1 Tax=Colletotrichum cuscutae TaxID=1209917 RepID=A0AAI9TXH4_9PEZI|nr:hypothetical protein CCUS01_12443 [Colletotrichum cuscutae]